MLADAPTSNPTTQEQALVDPGLWPALRRRLWLPVVLAIILGAVGAYLGQKRNPQYTAVTRLNIGTVNYRTESVPGFVTAAQTLAQSYGLIVDSAQILGPLAHARHTSEAALANAISSTAVPNSTIFSITAKRDTGAEAVTLANAAARQTQRTIGRLNTTTADENSVLASYHKYTLQATFAQQKLGLLRAQRTSQNAAGQTPTVTLAMIANQQTLISEALAKAGAYSVDYQGIVSGNAPQAVARLITVVQPATTAASNKRTYLERYILFGIAAGLVAGVLLALIIPRRRRKVASAS